MMLSEKIKNASHIRISSSRGWMGLNLRELWEFRDLLTILAMRDVKLRYKQTALGVIWVILQPLITALIFAIVFGGFARLPSDGKPYILFVFAGLLPWQFFSSCITRGGGSLVGSASMISKVYFPRLLVPLASNGAVLIDFIVAFFVMVVLMFFYHIAPTWNLVSLPFFILITFIAAMGVSFWVSSLNVYYRDFMFALPFVIQAWTFASPVAYAMSIVPEQWRWLFSLNPAVGFIEGFRWALLGSSSLNIEMVTISTISSLFLFFSGLFYFLRVERGFADII